MALDAASERAESILERLEASVTAAEERLSEARRAAERSIAVANELRLDAGSLIAALQGLAVEVDAQIREHTAALMASISDLDGQAEAVVARPKDSPLSEEVSGLIEELRATAHDITLDLERKSDELRRLIDEAPRGRLEYGLRHQAPAPANAAVRTGTASAPPTSDEPLAGVRVRAQAVRDEVQLSQRRMVTGNGRYSQARDLAAMGLGADEIARRCGLGREEVRMLLRLQGPGDK